MREIVPGIFTWPWFSERHGYDFNGYLVRDPGGNLCIDPVEMSDEVMEAIAREGVARILLTNRNHTRASARVRARTGARVAMHPADAPHAREQGAVIDEDLVVGATVGPFTVVDASGKSPGEVALYAAARRLLVVGDAVVGKPRGGCSLLSPKVIDDLPALQRSVRRLAEELDFEVLLPGDGEPILSGARAALRALVATFPG
jgi:glyoxylase-like metal-dependent hydrolase (beta-lactamase superfamily II)